MPTRTLVATHNRGKLREYQALLKGLPLEVLSLADLGIDLAVDEKGSTFEENAIHKAQTYAQASSLITLADDSGLEVEALGGRPGVLSSRYAGPQKNDLDRIDRLLKEMEGIPEEKRSARFRCVIALATPEGELHTAEGECRGTIATQPRGSHGFGYDPVFWLPEYSRTMAELDTEAKNKISHRARAMQQTKAALIQLLSSPRKQR
jgi:XTP/dITP diphosphohydrolase